MERLSEVLPKIVAAIPVACAGNFAGQLPRQFSTLKQDIKYSIQKFNEAYNIAELNGSKLKDLLYGIED